MGYSSALSIAVRTRRAYVGDRAIVERRERIPRYAQAALPTAGNMSFDVAGVTDQDDLAFRNNANAAWVLLRAIFGPINADYVVGTANAILTNELVLGTAVIMAGTLAARPAASLAGRLYAATDTLEVYRDTGAAWTLIATGVLGQSTHHQVVLDWSSTQNLVIVLGGGGAFTLGGTGQANMRVADNAADVVRVENNADGAGAADSSFTVANNPRLSIPVIVDAFRANARMFFGLRATPGNALPAVGENHAGFMWNGANFQIVTGNAGGQNAQNVATPGVGAKHALDTVFSAGLVTFLIDGVSVGTSALNLPVGTLDWAFLLFSNAAGGATTSNVTLRRGWLDEA